MKPLLFFVIAISLCRNGSGQQATIDSTEYCSKIINQVSYYWKLDSLANNGFRLCAYKRLLNCRLDKIYRGLLLDKLGKPNTIRKTNYGAEYVYYVYDSKAMPQENERPFECVYITFKFGEYEKYLNGVEEGVIDY